MLPNSQIPYIADYVKIACALINRYLPELVTKDAVVEEQMASKMLYLSKQKKLSLKDLTGVLANGKK